MFINDLRSGKCQSELESELLLTRKLYVSSFPALVLSQGIAVSTIPVDYNNSDNIIKQILQKLNTL